MLIGRGGARNYPLRAAARSTNFTYVESVYPPSPIRIIPPISGFSRSRRKAVENRDRLFFPFFPLQLRSDVETGTRKRRMRILA